MNAPAPRPVWIDRPWIDLLIGCGGWSLPLLALSYAVVDGDVPRWSAVFYGLALVCNYPHYMATIYRAYGRDDRGAHRLYTHWLTGRAHRPRRRGARLVPAGAVALHRLRDVEPVALHRPELRRADDVPAPGRRRRVGRGTAAAAPRLPRLVHHAAGGVQHRRVRGSAGAVARAAADQRPHRRSRRRPHVPRRRAGRVRAARAARAAPRAARAADALLDAGALVRAAGGGELDGVHRHAADPLQLGDAGGDALGAVPVDHALLREARRRAGGPRRRLEPVALLGDPRRRRRRALPADPVARQLRLARRLHRQHLHRGGDRQPAPLHDRRRGVEAAQPARRASAGAGGWRPPRTAAPAATGAATAEPRQRRRPAFTWAWRAALVAALALLAAVDQWRYVLAIGHGERDRLAEAARLNPYDSGTYLRLAQAESEAGDPAAAAAALRRAVDVNPQNPRPRAGAGAPADRSQPVRRGLPRNARRCWRDGRTTSTRS